LNLCETLNLGETMNNEHWKQLGRDSTKPAAAIVTVRKRVDLRLQSTPITRSLLSRTADASGDGSWLGVAPFSGEGRPPMGEVIGTELDGRLLPDLSTLTPENPVTPADNFFIRTRASKLLDPSKAWTVQWPAALRNRSSLQLRCWQRKKKAGPMGIHGMECSGNTGSAHFGMMSVAAGDGVSLQEILKTAKPKTSGVRVPYRASIATKKNR
jgi:hypothetical protein